MHYGASGAVRGARTVGLARHVLSEWRWRLGVAASLGGAGSARHRTTHGLGFDRRPAPGAGHCTCSSRWPSATCSTAGCPPATYGRVGCDHGPSDWACVPDRRQARRRRGAAGWTSSRTVDRTRGSRGAAWPCGPSRRFRAHTGLLLGTAGGIVFGLMRGGTIKSTTGAWSVAALHVAGRST